MHRCKAPEILRSEAYFRVRRNDEGREIASLKSSRSEAYFRVRRNDEGRGKRRRWAFFNSRIE